MTDLPRYPRTLHLGRSGGGTSKHCADLGAVAGAHVVVEEKVDGSHAGLCFDDEANLILFHRNSILASPCADPEFKELHSLAHRHTDALWDILQDRYVVYCEWAQLAHSMYYDALPAYFLEDDIFDRGCGAFLSTGARRELVAELPSDFSSSVHVLAEGRFEDLFASEEELTALIGPSHYRSKDWRKNLFASSSERAEVLAKQSSAEGLYIKHEADGVVKARYKWVREDFIEEIKRSGTHWRNQAPLRNKTAY